MRILNTAMLSAYISVASSLFCQQEPMPDKVPPEVVKMLKEQEQQMTDSIKKDKKHPGPKYGYFDCRAEAQKWTSDPSDSQDARNLSANAAILVNGQIRAIPAITPHVTATGLMERAYEMAVCVHEDADFEKQFNTYSFLQDHYNEERSARYSLFLLKHNLMEQFVKEDAEDYK